MTRGEADELRVIKEAHRSDGHLRCYAESLGPISVHHSGGGSPRPKVLRCTRPLGHERERHEPPTRRTGEGSPHVDGVCCWVSHEFAVELAGPPQPELYKTEHCVECGREWPCDVARIFEILEAPDPTHQLGRLLDRLETSDGGLWTGVYANGELVVHLTETDVEYFDAPRQLWLELREAPGGGPGASLQRGGEETRTASTHEGTTYEEGTGS